MANVSWTVRPHAGVGPLSFGMARVEVRTLLGADYAEFRKSRRSRTTTDAYDRLGLHLYYDQQDQLTFVETFLPLRLTYAGIDLSGPDVDKVLVPLAAAGLRVRSKGGSYFVDEAGIAVYAPDERIEGVAVYPPGYYEGRGGMLPQAPVTPTPSTAQLGPAHGPSRRTAPHSVMNGAPGRPTDKADQAANVATHLPWTIRPHAGVGPLAFGMARAEVCALLGADYAESEQSRSSGAPIDTYDRLGVRLYYNQQDRLALVEAFSPMRLTYAGIDLSGSDVDKVLVPLAAAGLRIEFAEDGYLVNEIGMALYARDDRIERVSVCPLPYYDQRR